MATKLFEGVKNAWNYVSGPGKFLDTGQLTPEEFVQAGDHLIHVGSKEGWKWMPAVAGRENKSLKDPKKQYILIEGVACEQRATSLFKNSNEVGSVGVEQPVLNEDDEDYVVIAKPLEVHGEASGSGDASEQSGKPAQSAASESGAAEQTSGAEKKPEDQKTSDEAEIRYYNISICYDTYYYVPHLFLSAVDVDGKPIAQEKIFEDIASETVNKVVTIDPQPATGERQVSIHPCKHANVLKMFTELISEGRGKEAVGPHLALLIFLKFFGGIAPTIQVDVNYNIEMA